MIPGDNDFSYKTNFIEPGYCFGLSRGFELAVSPFDSPYAEQNCRGQPDTKLPNGLDGNSGFGLSNRKGDRETSWKITG